MVMKMQFLTVSIVLGALVTAPAMAADQNF